MRIPHAPSAWLGGLVLTGVAVVAQPPIATVALGAALVLLPVAAVIDLSRSSSVMRAAVAKPVLIAGLFASGVLAFADDESLRIVAFAATTALLIATGFVEGRLAAVRWAAVLVLSALTADALWQLDWEPFDRSDQYEPIGQFPFVLIGLPVLMALVAVGVVARWLWRRLTRA